METAWCLFELAKHQDVQARLRKEISSVTSDEPSADELNDLPFLDAVVRETLRFHAALPITLRVAQRDDVIPTGELFIDKKRKEHSEIRSVRFSM